MPIYEFCCPQCGVVQELRQSEPNPPTCQCGTVMRRKYSPCAFTFGFRLSDDSHIPGHKDELVKNI